MTIAKTAHEQVKNMFLLIKFLLTNRTLLINTSANTNISGGYSDILFIKLPFNSSMNAR